MKFLFFALDTATYRAIIDLNQRTNDAGHECETLIYTRNKPLEAKIIKRYQELKIPYFISRAFLPVSPREFFKNKNLRAETDFIDKALIGGFYIILRLFRRIDSLRKKTREGFFGRNGSRMLSYYLTLLADHATAAEILEERKIDALILSHDYVGHFSSILSKMAKKKNIPVVIVPALFTVPEQILRIYQDRQELQVETKMERKIARKYPEWTMEVTPHTGRRVLRLEWWRIVLLRRLGLSPKHPWAHHSNDYVDYICLPDERMRDKYERLGFDANKLKVTGSGAQEKILAKMTSSKKKTHKKPLLSVALPPDQFLKDDTDFRHASLDSQLNELSNALETVRASYDILLMVHPKEDPHKYQLLKDAGFKFASQDTAEIIPETDVYLSYIGSSTNEWAHWAGVPNIQWDIYDYLDDTHQRGFKNGVIEVVNGEELKAALAELSTAKRRNEIKPTALTSNSNENTQTYYDHILELIASI